MHICISSETEKKDANEQNERYSEKKRMKEVEKYKKLEFEEITRGV